MALAPRIQTATEKYHCSQCEKYFTFLEVHQTWKCPDCNHLINIKVSVDGFFHNCQRVSPSELKVEELVTLENEHIHEILNISKEQGIYRIALKEYRVISLDDNDCITRVDGAWCLNYIIMQRELDDYYADLTDEEKHFIDLYKSNTDSFAYNINDTLRGNLALDQFNVAIQHLDSAIEKFQNEEEITLHRATINALVSPFIVENEYSNPDYLSLATDMESVTGHFTNPNNPAYVKIICPPNTSMAPMEANPQFGGLENEILLGRNNRFDVIENRHTENRQEIEHYLGRFFAEGVTRLYLYTFRYRNPEE